MAATDESSTATGRVRPRFLKLSIALTVACSTALLAGGVNVLAGVVNSPRVAIVLSALAALGVVGFGVVGAAQYARARTGPAGRPWHRWAMAAAVCVAALLPLRSSRDAFLQGFAWHISLRADTNDIRRWGQALKGYYPAGSSFWVGLRNEFRIDDERQWPRAVASLSPETVRYRRADGAVTLEWDSQIGDGWWWRRDWGLTIGPVWAQPPDTRRVRRIADGVFVWSDRETSGWFW